MTPYFRCDSCGGRIRPNVSDLGGNWTFPETGDRPLRQAVQTQRRLTGSAMCRACCREYILLNSDQLLPAERDMILP